MRGLIKVEEDIFRGKHVASRDHILNGRYQRLTVFWTSYVIERLKRKVSYRKCTVLV